MDNGDLDRTLLTIYMIIVFFLSGPLLELCCKICCRIFCPKLWKSFINEKRRDKLNIYFLERIYLKKDMVVSFRLFEKTEKTVTEKYLL